MSTTAGKDRPQSLGAWLAGLRPGDACPWCNSPLGVTPKGAQRDGGATRSNGPAEGACALLCSKCGGEVEAADAASKERHVLLGHAA